MNSARVEFATKYYEIHVNHRRIMLNFVLVASAFLLSASVLAMEANVSFVPTVLSLFGVFSSVAFFELDRVTLKKIWHIENIISRELGENDLPEDERIFRLSISSWWVSDNGLTQSIELGAAIVFSILCVWSLIA